MKFTRAARILAAGFAFATLVSACSGSVTIGGIPEVSQSDVQTKVAAQLAAETSQPVPKVACPSGLQAKVGASIDCTLTAQGSTVKYPVHVTVKSVNNGTAHFDAQVGQAPGAANKTAFCNDNATLDKATASVQNASDLVAALKANQATIADFQATAPPEIVASAGPLAIAANNAISSGDITAFITQAIQADGAAVDAYCGLNPDGTPIAGSSTTTTSAA
jgi:hypothetical protein